MNDREKARILHLFKEGEDIGEHDADVLELCSSGMMIIESDGRARTTLRGLIELERIMKLYVVFLN